MTEEMQGYRLLIIAWREEPKIIIWPHLNFLSFDLQKKLKSKKKKKKKENKGGYQPGLKAHLGTLFVLVYPYIPDTGDFVRLMGERFVMQETFYAWWESGRKSV